MEWYKTTHLVLKEVLHAGLTKNNNWHDFLLFSAQLFSYINFCFGQFEIHQFKTMQWSKNRLEISHRGAVTY